MYASRFCSPYCTTSPISSAPWASKRATTASMSSTVNMMRRIPSAFTGAFSDPVLIASGVWNLSSSILPWPTGVRINARVARTSLSPIRLSTEGPSTVVSPSSSIPSSAKNALAASRSSTTMRTLSIRNNLLFAVIFLLRFGRPEYVPLPVDGVDQADGAAGYPRSGWIDLLPELPDAHSDRVRVALVIQPDPLLNILARGHSPLVEGERLQQRVLARGKRDLLAGAAHAVRLRIDFQVGDPNEPRLVDRVAADERPHPRPQFRQLERLRQVVIGTDLEAAQAILQSAARGQHQDRGRVPAPPERFAHLPAVHARQHQVQDDDGVLPLAGQRQRLAAVLGTIDGVARRLEALLNPPGSCPFIFDE